MHVERVVAWRPEPMKIGPCEQDHAVRFRIVIERAEAFEVRIGDPVRQRDAPLAGHKERLASGTGNGVKQDDFVLLAQVGIDIHRWLPLRDAPAFAAAVADFARCVRIGSSVAMRHSLRVNGPHYATDSRHDATAPRREVEGSQHRKEAAHGKQASQLNRSLLTHAGGQAGGAPQETVRFLPALFAQYSARSARASVAFRSSPISNRQTPAENEYLIDDSSANRTLRPSTLRRIRSTADAPCSTGVPGNTTRNSSPPIRPAMSD